MWCFGNMLAAMIFRKEPFFHGICNIDQLARIADVLGTDKLYRFVEQYDIAMDPEDLEALGHREVEPWTGFISDENYLVATEEGIDLVDRLLRFDPRVRRLVVPFYCNANPSLGSPYIQRSPPSCLLPRSRLMATSGLVLLFCHNSNVMYCWY